MKKEEKTIKKIQELVPEIMELKEGCRINGMGHSYAEVIKLNGEKVTLLHGGYRIDKENIQDIEEFCEILGRPISLEDCIIAMEKNEVKLRIDTEFEFIVYKKTDDDIGYKWKETDIFWKPNVSFHFQPDEVKDFIGDLLLAG